MRFRLIIAFVIVSFAACSCDETPAASSPKPPAATAASTAPGEVGAWQGTVQFDDVTSALLLDLRADGTFWRLEYVAADRMQTHEGSWRREGATLELTSAKVVEHSAKGDAPQQDLPSLRWTITTLDPRTMVATYDAPGPHRVSLHRSEPAEIAADRDKRIAGLRIPDTPEGKVFAQMKANKPDVAKILKKLDSGEMDAIGDRKSIMATMLCNAAAIGDKAGVTLLLGRGLDVNSVDERAVTKPTPLICAAMMGSAEVVTMLLARGADPNAKDARGRTAAYWAKEKGHDDVTRALTNAGKPAPAKGTK